MGDLRDGRPQGSSVAPGRTSGRSRNRLVKAPAIRCFALPVPIDGAGQPAGEALVRGNRRVPERTPIEESVE
jgi:hypothetical protein